MTPATETLVKKLVVFVSLVVLAGSIGFLLVACGGEKTAPLAQPRDRAGSAAGVWHALPAAPITVNAGLASVWTGTEMIVSGVRFGPGGNFINSTNVAAAYDPSTRTWRRLAQPPQMENFCRRDVAWTGKEMLVWGCGQAVLDPQTDSWRTLPKAPTGEGIVVRTGRELIGWGGGCCGDAWSGGSAYNPTANTWRKLARSPLAPSQGPVGAWTGRVLILFVSGYTTDGKPYPASIARAAAYDPATDTWRRLAPPPESGGTAVWDGREVLIVGAGARSQGALAYNPTTNRWRRLSPLPSSGLNPAAFWTGKRLLVWGSGTGSSAIPPAGLSYEPRADRWSVLARAPLRGSGQTTVWTGHELIVWGGVIGTPRGTAHPEEYPKYLAEGAALTPTTERSSR